MSLNGQKKFIKTNAQTIRDMLNELNMKISPNDRLSLSLNTRINKDLAFEVQTAHKITVIIKGKEQTFYTLARTVNEALNMVNIKPGIHNSIYPDGSHSISSNMKIEVKQDFPFLLVNGSKKKIVWSASATVADFLEQQGIQLNQLNEVEPGLFQPLKEYQTVTIKKVPKVSDVVEEPVYFTAVGSSNAEITQGIKEMVQYRENTAAQNTYEVMIENVKEIKRSLTGTSIDKRNRSKPRMGARKTESQALSSVNTGGEEIYVTATAYTGDCSGCSGYTATGINLRDNPNMKLIAVDPSVIPLGSKVYVEGYGYALAGDTGGGIKGNRIDVFFNSNSSACQWGVKRLKVQIVK
jgi:3D (Asp-Asp-Asp) domain-containing protein/sulfur carrier protein ThiS